jgi:hypothetical protein
MSLRREFVDRAVAFLGSEPVQRDLQTPGGDGRSRAFLQSMGLTPEEINTAFAFVLPAPLTALPVEPPAALPSLPPAARMAAPVAAASLFAGSGGLGLVAFAAVGALIGFAWTYFDVPARVREYVEPEGIEPDSFPPEEEPAGTTSPAHSRAPHSPRPEALSTTTEPVAAPSALLEAHRGAFREALDGARAAERENMAAVQELRALVAALNSSIAHANDETRRQQRVLDGSLQAVASDVAALRRDLSMSAAAASPPPTASSLQAGRGPSQRAAPGLTTGPPTEGISSSKGGGFQFSTPESSVPAEARHLAAAASVWPTPPPLDSAALSTEIPAPFSDPTRPLAPLLAGTPDGIPARMFVSSPSAADSSPSSCALPVASDALAAASRCSAARGGVTALFSQNSSAALEFAAPFVSLVLNNIIAHPDVPRYRKLAASNDSFRKCVVRYEPCVATDMMG